MAKVTKGKRKATGIKVRFRHRVIFAACRFFFGPFLKWKYKFRAVKFDEKKAGIKAPYLVLAPHYAQTDPIFVGMSFRRPIYYVANEDIFTGRFLGWLLRFCFSPLPKTKGMPDVNTIRDIISVRNQGGVVGIFPEGNTSFTGCTSPIPKAISRLVLMLKIPVVFYGLGEMFFTAPRFGHYVRRKRGDRAEGKVVRILMPEEYAGMEAAELQKLIEEQLRVDMYEEARKNPARFKGKALAEYVERATYQCPVCKKLRMTSAGDLLGCPDCGYRVRYSETGFFEEAGFPVIYDNVRDWYAFQKEYLRGIDFSAWDKSTPLFYDDNVTLLKNKRLRKGKPVGKGRMTMYVDRLELTGEDFCYTVPFSDIDELVALMKRRVAFFHKDGHIYKILGEPNLSGSKYFLYYHSIKGDLDSI